MNATKSRAHDVAKALTPFVNTLLMAKAYAELERERVDAIQRRVLSEDVYTGHTRLRLDDGGEEIRILDPKHKHLMDDADSQRYFAKLNEIHLAEGFAKAADGFCPALVAESLQRKAERALIDASGKYVDGMSADRMALRPDMWDKAVDLLIGMVVNQTGYKNPLTGKVVAQ